MVHVDENQEAQEEVKDHAYNTKNEAIEQVVFDASVIISVHIKQYEDWYHKPHCKKKKLIGEISSITHSTDLF